MKMEVWTYRSTSQGTSMTTGKPLETRQRQESIFFLKVSERAWAC